MAGSPERMTVKILPEENFRKDWDRLLKDTHSSRGTLRFPIVIHLPGKRVLVAQNVPGFSQEIDLDPDVLR